MRVIQQIKTNKYNAGVQYTKWEGCLASFSVCCCNTATGSGSYLVTDRRLELNLLILLRASHSDIEFLSFFCMTLKVVVISPELSLKGMSSLDLLINLR